MTPERPNFYELPELDPAVDDWAKIKERLGDKRGAWSSAKYEGPMYAQRRAADNLARVRDIEAVLSVDESRRQEAVQAIKRRDARRSERRKELAEKNRAAMQTLSKEQHLWNSFPSAQVVGMKLQAECTSQCTVAHTAFATSATRAKVATVLGSARIASPQTCGKWESVVTDLAGRCGGLASLGAEVQSSSFMEDQLSGQPDVEIGDCREAGRAVIEFGRPLKARIPVEATWNSDPMDAS